MKMPKLCSPAMLYLVISVIAIIMAFFNKIAMSAIITKVIFIAIWTWFLNFLCSKGHSGISWFLVVIPYIILLVVMFIALEVVKKNNNTSTMMMNAQKNKK